LPPPGSAFRFVSPRIEDSLNGAGGLRVDANNAEMVASDQVVGRPEILKVLFRGSQLDLEIYDRLMSRGLGTVDEFWRDGDSAPQDRHRFAGNGYQKLRPSSRVRKDGDNKPGVSAFYLSDLPLLTHKAMGSVLVDTAELPPFSLERIHDPRPRGLFRGPLLLVHESPPARRRRIRVAVSDNDLIFNQSYYGYSAKEHPDGKRLVRYLAMLVGSKVALWYALMTSGKFGFERETIEKLTIDKIAAPLFEALDPSDLKQIDQLFEALIQQNSEGSWGRVDAWVASLLGLRKHDLRIIADTLSFNLPFSRNRRAAQALPSPPDIAEFCSALASELGPWVQRAGKEVEVVPVNMPIASPWGVVQIGSALTSAQFAKNQDWTEILRIADQLAATEIVHPDSAAGCLWLARLNQARYWSYSQARLVARRIAWEHVEFLVGLEGK
jgi:hypothetical protein